MNDYHCKTSLEIRTAFENWVKENPEHHWAYSSCKWNSCELMEEEVIGLIFGVGRSYRFRSKTVSVLYDIKKSKDFAWMKTMRNGLDYLDSLFRWNSVNHPGRELVGFEQESNILGHTTVFLLIRWDNGYYYGVSAARSYVES